MIKKAINFLRNIQQIDVKLNYIQQSLGRIENRQLFKTLNDNPNNYEFKVYSQSGEDGIIQYLINRIEINSKIFIEFGVENYTESNTRFLAINNYWSGLVIDGDAANIEFIKRDPIYWRCNIKAECSFITKDNINDIFIRNGITDEIGLLSIDIDGNDYWIWEAINCVNPAIIIAEYNSFFGYEREVTVPYNPTFVRSTAHYSKIYYGASIAALTNLANKKGYCLVASNQSGNNLFFVRKDLMHNFKELTIKEAYRPINFRESHNIQGGLTYSDFKTAKKLIDDLVVYDIQKNEEVTIKSLL
jgi:hypothetical protein